MAILYRQWRVSGGGKLGEVYLILFLFIVSSFLFTRYYWLENRHNRLGLVNKKCSVGSYPINIFCFILIFLFYPIKSRVAFCWINKRYFVEYKYSLDRGYFILYLFSGPLSLRVGYFWANGLNDMEIANIINLPYKNFFI